MSKYKKRYYKKKKNPTEKLFAFLEFTSVLIAFYTFQKTHDIRLTLIALISSMMVFAIAIFLYKTHKNKLQKQKYIESGIDIVDKMDGDEFEHFLLAHFEKLGYKGEVTKKSNDYGADLVLKNNNERIAIQAKRWNEKVGIKAIQEVVAAINYYGADKGMVITNNYFTNNAYELARSNNIQLWDREKLIEIMSASNGRSVAQDVKPEASVYTCPSCRGNLILREGKNGKFYGCSNFPRCRYTINHN